MREVVAVLMVLGFVPVSAHADIIISWGPDGTNTGNADTVGAAPVSANGSDAVTHSFGVMPNVSFVDQGGGAEWVRGSGLAASTALPSGMDAGWGDNRICFKSYNETTAAGAFGAGDYILFAITSPNALTVQGLEFDAWVSGGGSGNSQFALYYQVGAASAVVAVTDVQVTGNGHLNGDPADLRLVRKDGLDIAVPANTEFRVYMVSYNGSGTHNGNITYAGVYGVPEPGTLALLGLGGLGVLNRRRRRQRP